MIKSLKFTDGREEYEISFRYCYNDNPNYDYVWCDIKTDIKDLKVNKYEVKYITYDNEKMEPKDHSYFYYITEEVILKSFPNSIPKKKDLKLRLEFNNKFTEPIDFYFIEINHSYIIYKIHVHPQGDWENYKYPNGYDYIYSYKKNFIFDTENIPSGKYKIEWVFENIRKEGNFITEVKNE